MLEQTEISNQMKAELSYNGVNTITTLDGKKLY